MAAPRLRRDLLVNLTTSLLGAVMMMVMLRESARVLAPVTLGVFLLARRWSDLLANLVQLGTPLAVRRYLSLTGEHAEQRQWLRAALVLFTTATLLFLAVWFAAGPLWRRLLWGSDPVAPGLMLAIAGVTIAMAGTNLAMSAMMAFRRFAFANTLQMLNGSGVLLVAVLVLGTRSEPARLLQVQAVVAGTAVVLSLGLLLARLRAATPDATPALGPCLRESLGYGLPRTVAPFMEVLLFVLGPWLLREDPAAAGALILALTLLRVANIVVQPLALVGGLAAARAVGAGDQGRLSDGVNYVTGMTVLVGLLGCAATYPWLPPLLRLWLGSPTLATSVFGFAAGIFVALAPYMLFQGLKPIVEATWKQPRMLYGTVASVATLVGTYLVARRSLPAGPSAVLAMPAAFAVAGGAAVVAVWPLLRGWGYFRWHRQLACAGAAFLLNHGVHQATSGLPLLAQCAVALALMAATMLAALACLVWLWPVPCLGEALGFLFPTAPALAGVRRVTQP